MICVKNPFSMFFKILDEMKKNLPLKYSKCTKKRVHFLAQNVPPWCAFTLLEFMRSFDVKQVHNMMVIMLDPHLKALHIMENLVGCGNAI
jgi:hypothetical protein